MTQMSSTSIFHSSDSSLYNLVLNNTVIIVYKLMYLSDITECASSPILCCFNPILTEEKSLD